MQHSVSRALLLQVKKYLSPTYDGTLYIQLDALRAIPYGDGTVGSHWPDTRRFLIDCFTAALLQSDDDLSGSDVELAVSNL